MNEDILPAVWALVSQVDTPLWEITTLSLQVSFAATLIASAIAIPLGALVAVTQFRGQSIVVATLNAMMGLPPVVIGLVVYLLLSRAGPLGDWGILFTPSAMIMAQCCLIIPIIAALSRQLLEAYYLEYRDQLHSLGISRWGYIPTLIWDARFQLLTAILAGFGRAIAEVGAVMIVGGNINHVTRVMTTTIALETSKGNLNLALALGAVLVLITLLINLLAMGFKNAAKHYGD